MNDSVKARMGIIYNAIEAMILLACTGAVGFGAGQLIDQGKAIVSISTRVAINTTRLDRIEDKGSVGLQTHEREDNTRIVELRARLDKVEAAIIALQQTPGKLEAISEQIKSIQAGQVRIERMVEDHLKRP